MISERTKMNKVSSIIHSTKIFLQRNFERFSTSEFYTNNVGNNSSRSIYWLIVVTVIIVSISLDQWNADNRVITSDIKGYYTYLPATFIHHDLSLKFIGENIDFFRGKVWFHVLPDGSQLIQFTYGLSLLYLPFFLLAHLFSYILGFEPNGYTILYKIALVLSSIFYFALGLHFLRKTLLRYFNELSAGLTLLSLAIGTNLLYYLTYEAPMSHAYSFSIISVFLYLTTLWHDKPDFKKSLLIGLLSGLIVLLRPTNVVVAFVFILWNVHSFQSLKDRLLLFLNKYYLIITILFFAFLVWVPQFLYWKYITGDFLFFSYGDRAYFFFLDPEVTNILFSYRKGWLLYTPLMLLAVFGIPFLYKRIKGTVLPISVFLFINVWVLASWCFWWFGGGFGSRGMIDSYGIMAFPLAGFFYSIFSVKKKWLNILVVGITLLLIYFNTFQVRQYANGAIHYVSMTKKAYWETFAKLKPNRDFYDYLEYPDYKSVEKRILRAKGKLPEVNEEN